MAAINDLSLILHNIRVKLYPNYLPTAKGKYLARTDSDKTVNVKDICTIMVTRAGFDGSIDTLYDYVVQFFDEMAYQLCDGFTVNSGYFTIRPNVGGTFDSAAEIHDHCSAVAELGSFAPCFLIVFYTIEGRKTPI
jgi:hypothetical protein